MPTTPAAPVTPDPTALNFQVELQGVGPLVKSNHSKSPPALVMTPRRLAKRCRHRALSVEADLISMLTMLRNAAATPGFVGVDMVELLYRGIVDVRDQLDRFLGPPRPRRPWPRHLVAYKANTSTDEAAG